MTLDDLKVIQVECRFDRRKLYTWEKLPSDHIDCNATILVAVFKDGNFIGAGRSCQKNYLQNRKALPSNFRWEIVEE